MKKLIDRGLREVNVNEKLYIFTANASLTLQLLLHQPFVLCTHANIHIYILKKLLIFTFTFKKYCL